MRDEPLKPEVILPGQPGTGPDLEVEEYATLELIAWLMDRSIVIPGTKIAVGLDAILGLLPIGGDALASLVQAGIVLTAVTKYQVPRAVAARMISNVLIDLGVGSVPLVGDIFDVFFKANTRNMALLREARGYKRMGRSIPAAPSRRYLITLGVALVGGLLLLTLGFIALATWVVKLVWNAGT